MKKFAFYTLGCRANQYQTDRLKSSILQAHKCTNAEVIHFSKKADTYVINTCMVTLDAERKSRQAIRRALRQNPKAKIFVAGCYAILAKKELGKSFPNIEIMLADPLQPRSLTQKPNKKVRRNLMIQDGCEHFCAYCIVPYARGKVRSKPLPQVIDEARQLVASGAREIILTGINLGTYGKDFSDLCSMLRALCSLSGLLRLRISSIEPMYLTQELIDVIAKTGKVCHHLHIPVQSGDNNILKAMKRNYTCQDFIEIVDYIRRKIPDCAIATDIMVGFPGEGGKEFQNTIDLVNQIKFSRIHVFSYSKRAKTSAAKLSNQVDTATKKHRNIILQQLRIKYMEEFAKPYLGKDVEILVEQKGEGLTNNFIRCFFDDPKDSSGQLKQIRAKTLNHLGEIQG
ncbi:MAG: MiaB/RimO family radical SAM methylthiotransferase [Candidatus Saganbacteria bacterium]|nr:MiaB/RimO family radical SAM methylthiotransferase [Candidatus Saganbacteria bacterium]